MPVLDFLFFDHLVKQVVEFAVFNVGWDIGLDVTGGLDRSVSELLDDLFLDLLHFLAFD